MIGRSENKISGNEVLFAAVLWLLAAADGPFCAAAEEQAGAGTTNRGQEAGGQARGSVGRALFTGTVRFKNGGPPCFACHSVAGLPFPHGGSLGPDLTTTYTKLGLPGMEAAMRTLFFPTMTPIFRSRPLTVLEQQDLKALFEEGAGAGGRGEGRGARGEGRGVPEGTTAITGIACAGCLGLLAVTWGLWRNRPGPVRGGLVGGEGRKGQRRAKA